MSNQPSKLVINVVSIVVPIVVALLLGIQQKFDLGPWTRFLPHVIGVINTLTAACLILGLIFIKSQKISAHRLSMLTAFSLGAVFLVCYILYHVSNPHTRFGGKGVIWFVYYSLLVSHIALSIIVLPFVLRALFYGLTRQFEAHRRVAKIAFPVWLYVSISGVLVYLLIRPYYASVREEDSEVVASVRVDQPFGNDPGQRKALAEMITSRNEFTEDKWMRSFTLTERSGKEMSSKELAGQPFVASFFFSKCPGSCKQQNDQMRLLQQKYRHKPIRLVSISVDPENDTPEVLSAYADSYEAIQDKWLFFTGDINYIGRMAAEMFFLGQIGPKAHPDRFCLVNADGDVVGKYNWHNADELQSLDDHIAELIGK
jgi:putative membrane protein